MKGLDDGVDGSKIGKSDIVVPHFYMIGTLYPIYREYLSQSFQNIIEIAKGR